MHIGKESVVCPELKIHGYKMEKVTSDKYLGDILSSDGKNIVNLKDRIGKGLGIISEIMSILDTISFGFQYFRMLILLREAMFVNGTLTNAEIWYGVKNTEWNELEDLDRLLIRRALQCPATTPKEAYHLELGLLPIRCIVKARRVNYLHYIIRSKENGMLFKFFQAQYDYPSKDDWTEQVKVDLKDLGILEDFSYIRSFTETAFKNMVKRKIKEFALDDLNEKKFEHSKMDNLVFTELKMQEYLLSGEITTAQKRNIFRYRTRMADYSENYPEGNTTKPCKVCHMHTDCQAHAVSCYETLKSVTKKGKYGEIFSNKISRDTAIMLEQIMEIRKNKMG